MLKKGLDGCRSLVGDGDADTLDGSDFAFPEVGLALPIVEVQLNQARLFEVVRKFGVGVIRLDMYFPDIFGDVFVCRFALQSPAQCLLPGIDGGTFEAYNAQYVRMDLDVQRGVILGVKTDTHACLGSHGKTLSVERGARQG